MPTSNKLFLEFDQPTLHEILAMMALSWTGQPQPVNRVLLPAL